MHRQVFLIIFALSIFASTETKCKHNAFRFVPNKSEIKQLCSRNLMEYSESYTDCKNIEKMFDLANQWAEARTEIFIIRENNKHKTMVRLFKPTLAILKKYNLERKLNIACEEAGTSAENLLLFIPNSKRDAEANLLAEGIINAKHNKLPN